jgi:hypothetical protein
MMRYLVKARVKAGQETAHRLSLASLQAVRLLNRGGAQRDVREGQTLRSKVRSVQRN